MNKKIDQDQIATLEKERNAALERVLKRVKEHKGNWRSERFSQLSLVRSVAEPTVPT